MINITLSSGLLIRVQMEMDWPRPYARLNLLYVEGGPFANVSPDRIYTFVVSLV